MREWLDRPRKPTLTERLTGIIEGRFHG